MDEDSKKLYNNKRNYLCKSGHMLEFFTGSFQKMSESKCIICDEKELSRSFCPKCDEFYCVNCRVPQACKKSCPIGHPFEKLDKSQLDNYICDICGIKPIWVDKGINDDRLCNFGVCDICLDSLP